MSSPTQRWIFLLSVCLMLQQFAPVYTTHVKKHTPLQDENNNSSKDQGVVRGEKKGIIISAAKFIGGNLLSGVTYTANAVAFGATVLQAIAGCSVTQPTIQEDANVFQDLQKEYDSIAVQMREISRLASERQIYAKDSFYNYRDTRDLVSDLANEQERVLESMGPEAMIVVNNVTKKMERIFKKANETQQEVDVLEVDTKFAEGFELGMRLTMTTAAIAIPGLKLLWKKYLKHTAIGKRITGFIEKFSSNIKAPPKAGAKRFTKLLSKGVLGRAQTKIAAKLNKIITRVGPKFAKAKKLFRLAKAGLKNLMKLGGAALAVWTAVESFDNCRRKAEEAKDSVAKMKSYVAEIKGHLKNVTEANQEVQEAWFDVYNTTTADNLLEALGDIREMMLEDYFSKDQKEKEDIAAKIQDYLDIKNLDPNQEDTKNILNDRQRAMNEVMGKVTVTLKCFRLKGNTFNAVKMECARGDSPFPYIYDNVLNLNIVSPTENCRDRTGEEYITEEKMKAAWTSWVEANNTKIDAVCSMNKKSYKKKVEDCLKRKITDPSKIAEKMFSEAKINRGGIQEVEAMIAKIREENPNIENEFTDEEKWLLCIVKSANGDNHQAVIDALKMADPILAAKLTVDIVKTMQCD